MASGPATEQLSRIDDTLAQMQTDAVAYQTDTTATFVSILNALSTGPGWLAEIHALLVAELQAIRTQVQISNIRLTTIAGQAILTNSNLELLINNGSKNAQNAQTILLASAGLCCEPLIAPDGKPDNLCQRQQALIFRICNVATGISGWEPSGLLPSKEEIKALYTFTDWAPGGPVYITDAEALAILSFLTGVPPLHLASLADLCGNVDGFNSLMSIFTFATDATDANRRLASYSHEFSPLEPSLYAFVRLLFPPSIVNFMYEPLSYLSEDSFDNDACGGPEPTAPCTDFIDNEAEMGAFGTSPTTWYRPTLTLVSPLWTDGNWLRIVMRDDEEFGPASAELWRTDRVPTEKVADLEYGVPYDFMKPVGSSLAQFQIRFLTSEPEGWSGGTLYHHFDACLFFADGAEPVIPPA